jgi:Ser/Thr protein kinase RdoA (MazF antagonist)
VLSPPERTLDWVARQIGRDAKVVAVRRMLGGSSTAVHEVDVRDRGGGIHALVLRRFIRPNWKYPGLPRREARVLQMLERARHPAPRLVAFDDGPRETDARAVLMTRLPGRVELAPKRVGAWLRAMAVELPRIHDIALDVRLRGYRPYYDPRALDVPRWSRRKRAWRRLLDLASSRQPRTKPSFIHRDYHPGNILWRRGAISGVVDWISACAGPPQVDVAHCRVNLVRLHSMETADRFLAAYAAAAGARVHDYEPYWDAMAVADTGFGDRTSYPESLPLAVVRSRLDEYAVAIAGRG